MKCKKLFYNDDVLANFELENQWEECLVYLNQKWNENIDRKDIVFRIAVECWYVLTFWDICIPKEKLQRAFFETHLENAYLYSSEHYLSDSDYLWLFGYLMFISQSSFNFLKLGFLELESYANELIKKAHEADPNNRLAEVMYLADYGKREEYIGRKNDLKNSITSYFPTNSAVDQYFIEIFTSDF